MAKNDNQTKKQSEQEFRDDNPEATPYDMLMAGVINQTRFEELDSANKGTGTMTAKQFAEQQKNNPVQVLPTEQLVVNENKPVKTQTVKEFAANKNNKLVPTKVIKHATQPELTNYDAPKTGNVFLNDKKTGKSTWMSVGAAERERRKYPHRYVIS